MRRGNDSLIARLRRPAAAFAAIASAMLLMVCSRKPPTDMAAPTPIRADDAATPFTACRAVESDAGTVEERFAAVLADSRGSAGMVYVFQGDVSAVTDFMSDLDVDPWTVTCPGQYLLVFIPGVDEELGRTFDKQLAAYDGGVVSLREQHFLPWVPQTGRTRPPPEVGDAAPSPLAACHGVNSDAGTVEERFAEVLTYRRRMGGMVYVVEGDSAKITKFIADFGLRQARVAVCPDDTVVLFVPGFDARAFFELKELLTTRAGATVREHHLLAPVPAPPKVRKRRAEH